MNLPQDQFGYIPCEGGCDFVTPVLWQKPGRLRECKNLEVGINGGYWDIVGYERFDGQASPSDAAYTVLAADITGSVEVADTVTGATSGATGYVIAVEAAAIIVTKVTGTFVDAEDVEVSSVVEATLTDDPVAGGASTPALNAQYLNLAADAYRADIAAVTGAGDILGVVYYNSVLYAFRNNAGSSAAALYKSTASGWAAVSLGRELSFTSGGTHELLEGDTITGATSAATAVIARIVLTSGAWADGDAAGKLILTSQTGTFQSENLDEGANLNVATISGDSTAITLQPSGRFKFVIENFSGATGTRRVYGVDGVNRGFEFDGTVFVPIDTGMATDTPENLIGHKNHLFFSFGASVQHSSITTPYIWSPVTGAAELAMGDNVTGFAREMGSEAGGALIVVCRNSAAVLYGNGSSDWKLIPMRDEIGAFANSIQDMGQIVRLDDRGIGALRVTDAFGNFAGSTLSQLVNPWIQQRKTTVKDSCIVREKNQYRIFFNDKSALYVTFSGNKVLGMMTCQLADKVTCMHSVENASGNEVIFFGSEDGWVFQMEKGTSFDGDAIESLGFINYAPLNSPGILKRFKSAVVEARGSGYAEFSLGYELGYSDQNIHQPTSSATAADFETQVEFQESRWDAGMWDTGYWDGVSVSPSSFEVCGTAENIGFIIYKNSDEYQPVAHSGIRVRYQPRRIMR